MSNVHVRYEDRTNSSAPFALGLRLTSLQIKAIDEQGRTRFVERAPGQPVRKSVDLKELTLYVNAELQVEVEAAAGHRRAAPAEAQTGSSALAPAPSSSSSSSRAAAAANAAASGSEAGAASSSSHAASSVAFAFASASASASASSTSSEPLLLEPLSGRILLVFDTSSHRPPGVPAAMAQLDFQVAAMRVTHAQYLRIIDLAHYAR